jgi:hypothetical protein
VIGVRRHLAVLAVGIAAVVIAIGVLSVTAQRRPPDTVVPDRLAGEVGGARAAISMLLGSVPSSDLILSEARCRKDGGVAFVFVLTDPPANLEHGVYAATDQWPPDGWDGGMLADVPDRDTELQAFLHGAEIACQ